MNRTHRQTRFTRSKVNQRRRFLLETLEDRRLLAGIPELVADVNIGPASSIPDFIVESGAYTFFVATDAESGRELWRTDGTAANTVRLTDFDLGASPELLTDVNGTLYFFVQDQLWKSNGSIEGTVVVKEGIYGRWTTSYTSIAAVGDRLVFEGRDPSNFALSGWELWSSDGTEAGTMMIEINPGSGDSSPFFLGTIDGYMFFDAFDGTSHGLWKTDGTTGNTIQMATDLWVQGHDSGTRAVVSKAAVVDDVLYFAANTGLWRTDGTEPGTWLVKNVGAYGLVALNDTLLFAGGEGELWRSDGTESGTILVKDINPGPSPSLQYSGNFFFSNLRLFFPIVSGNTAFFAAYTQEENIELWKTDGTTSGTVIVKDILPGGFSGLYNYFYAFDSFGQMGESGGSVYFAAYNDSYTWEIWVSDGTSTGTQPLSSLVPGQSFQASTLRFASSNGTLYFTFFDPTLGFELWKIEPGIVNNSPTVSGTVISSTDEDAAGYSVDLLDGASDEDVDDILSVANLSLASGDDSGIVVDGDSLTVDPAAYNYLAVGENAVVEYQYEIVDGNGGSVAQSATITIEGRNDAPSATNDQVIVPQGSSANVISVLTNDQDPDGDVLTIQSVSATARSATAVISPDQQSILYTPRTPTSTGIDTFTYMLVDPSGATSVATVTVTILANTVVVEPTSLESEVQTQQSTPDEPLDVVVNVNPSSYDAVINAVNALPPPAPDAQTVFITLAVSDGTYPGAVISPPPGVVIIINGYGGSITIEGASPALTVSSGQVLVENGVILTNTTDAPTILVTGGHLTVRNSTIEESTNFNRAAIEIIGGTVDLGTSESPGGNTFIVHGDGDFILNDSGNDIPAVGNVFLSDSPANDPPTIASIGAQQYTQTEVIVQVEALDPDDDALTYSVSFVAMHGGGSVNEPTGYTIDQDGLFHWTPGAGQLGQYTFEAAVSDGLQVVSDQFTVTTLGVVDGVLTIVGTSGIDKIEVKPTQGDIDRLSVSINEKDLDFKLKPKHNPDNPYNEVDRVLIHALGGDDNVDIHNKLQIDAEIHGGAGDDKLKGGDGHDIIFGGLGDDYLSGHDGNDFLIGGDGWDKLKGEKGNDILLAGRLADDFDTQFANLRAIIDTWASGFVDTDLDDDNEDDDLFDELAGELLDGGDGADWFIVGMDDKTDFDFKKNKDRDRLSTI